MRLSPTLLPTLALSVSVAHAQPDSVKFPSSVLEFPVVDLKFGAASLTGQASDLRVQETAAEIRVELSADVLFDFDKADIRPTAAQALHQAADLIRAHSTGFVRVEGHTDSKGNADYNQRLSERRANSVRLWLAQREHLTSVVFVTAGYGARRPVAPNSAPDGSDDPAGRQRNRRVELVLRK